MMYKLNLNIITNQPCSVNKITEDNKIISIPFAEDNVNYQEYLKWVAEGNTPEPAEGTE